MLDETYGFKFQTCGACGTSKQGSLGYAVTLQDVDANDRDVRIIDGYAIANYSEKLNFKVGLTKLPLTRANLDDKLRYFAGVFQGREGIVKSTHPFSGATVTSSPQPKGTFEYVGRVHYAFLDAEPGAGYQGSYLGDLKILTIGGGVAYQADAVYRNVRSAGVVQDNSTVNYTALAADVLFEYPTKVGTFTATAQYLKTDFDDGYKTNFNPGDRLVNLSGLNGQKNGGYVKAGYILPLKIGKQGLLQPYFLAESWKFAYLLGIEDQKITQVGGGLNYYIKRQNVRLTLEYLKTDFDKETGFIGARVDPITFAPIDKLKTFDTYRLMVQIGVF